MMADPRVRQARTGPRRAQAGPAETDPGAENTLPFPLPPGRGAEPSEMQMLSEDAVSHGGPAGPAGVRPERRAAGGRRA